MGADARTLAGGIMLLTGGIPLYGWVRWEQVRLPRSGSVTPAPIS